LAKLEDLTYLVPLKAFNILITGTIFGLSFFVPESPRWLTSKYRDEKAEKALQRVHRKNPDTDAATELHILQEARTAENTSGRPSQWKDLFKGANFRRFYCAFGILCCQQISGVQFIL
jgi:SP family sugar:H+ symporter-like MFS transporter